jgi:hypothetical protein
MGRLRRTLMTRNARRAAAYRRERRRLVGWSLVGIGLVMALVGGFTHLGRLPLIGWSDLLVGYPMAALLVLAGSLLVAMATGHSQPPSR